jgi:cell division septal protein FtsQ
MQVQYADLRYPNGFAVRKPQVQAADTKNVS